ncbi:hypothetical protein KY348_00490 [Candidatus Woesearchaeota archaeon]|nr:hypothetical protein [Candidatus Woesearchaeota archaeon]
MRIIKKRLSLNNKKGLGTEEWLELLPYIVLTVVVMVAIFALINLFVNISVDVKPVQREVLFYRLMYAPNSIMYMDNLTGRVHPGVISWDNFTNQTLDKSIAYDYERHISAKLILYNLEKEPIKTAYLNGLWFNRLEPLARSRIKGAGSAELYTKKIPVVYRRNDVNRAGYLKVEIIIPN